MTDLRKAAEMSLERLEHTIAYSNEEMKKIDDAKHALRQALSNEFNPDWNQVEALQESLREHMAEIQRLRQALAQPNSTCNGMPAYEGSLSKSQALVQPEQEPVAWMCSDELVRKGYIRISNSKDETWNIPLYTAPPKREWVGLTDEEIDGIYKTHHDQYGKCQTGGFDYER